MDFNGVLTTDEVREVETAVNEVIVKNLPVEITYPSKEELKTLDSPQQDRNRRTGAHCDNPWCGCVCMLCTTCEENR